MKFPNKIQTKYWFFLFAWVVILSYSLPIYAQPVIAPTERTDLVNYINSLKTDPCLENSTWGLKILNLNTGFEVYSHNGNQGFTPASVTKLITTATALMRLGGNYRFNTSLSYSGKINENGELNGDIIIKGGGDPTLGSDRYTTTKLETLLSSARESIVGAGIRKVNGRVIGDASIFEYALAPGTWLWEDLGVNYGAGPSGITMIENLLSINISPGDSVTKPAIINDIYPLIPGLKIINEVKTVKSGKSDVYIFGSEYSDTRYLRGFIDVNAKSINVKGAIPDPEMSAALLLYDYLVSSGVEITDGVASQRELSLKGEKPVEENTVLRTIISPSLKEILKVVNQNSHNLFAEHLHKILSTQKGGVGSNWASNKLIQDFWVTKGINESAFFIADGSGLSRLNYISPHNMTLVLKEIFNHKEFDVYFESMPILGKSGTLANVGKNIKNKENLRAKSGSMNRVRCYSGYLKNNKGEDWAFAVMFNNFSCSQADLIKKIETLFDKMLKSD